MTAHAAMPCACQSSRSFRASRSSRRSEGTAAHAAYLRNPPVLAWSHQGSEKPDLTGWGGGEVMAWLWPTSDEHAAMSFQSTVASVALERPAGVLFAVQVLVSGSLPWYLE